MTVAEAIVRVSAPWDKPMAEYVPPLRVTRSAPSFAFTLAKVEPEILIVSSPAPP